MAIKANQLPLPNHMSPVALGGNVGYTTPEEVCGKAKKRSANITPWPCF